jgi:hypothetical protein
VPRELASADYTGEAADRAAFARWVQQMWLDKDRQIQAILGATPRSAVPLLTWARRSGQNFAL